MQVIEQLKRLSDERFLEIYQSLSKDGFGPLDGEVAKLLKFRPQAIKKLPFDKRARRARRLLEVKSNAELAYELFGTYLMTKDKQLILDFLDATGVEHEEGMIKDIEVCRPDPAKLATAVAELDGKYDQNDVTLYLSICAEQWPMVPEVEQLWRARP